MTRTEQFEKVLEKHYVFESPKEVQMAVWEYICQRVDELRNNEKDSKYTVEQWQTAEFVVYGMLDDEEETEDEEEENA